MTALAHAAMAGHAPVVRLPLADDRSPPTMLHYLTAIYSSSSSSSSSTIATLIVISSTNNSTSRTSAAVVGNGGGGGGRRRSFAPPTRAIYRSRSSSSPTSAPAHPPPVGEGERKRLRSSMAPPTTTGVTTRHRRIRCSIRWRCRSSDLRRRPARRKNALQRALPGGSCAPSSCSAACAPRRPHRTRREGRLRGGRSELRWRQRRWAMS